MIHGTAAHTGDGDIAGTMADGVLTTHGIAHTTAITIGEEAMSKHVVESSTDTGQQVVEDMPATMVHHVVYVEAELA